MATAVGICSVVARMFILGGASAHAASEPPAEQPDRITRLDQPAPGSLDDGVLTYEKSTAGAEVRVFEGSDFPVVPELGESVRLVYTNAVTELSTSVEGIDAVPCTVSLTTFAPYKSSNAARVSARGMVSAGCPSRRTITVTSERSRSGTHRTAAS
jgi:hypothetical protein